MYNMIFSGCYYHPGCCIPDEKIPNAGYKRHIWELKKQTLKQHGQLHVIRDCIWRKQKRQAAVNIPQTQIANILVKDTEGRDLIFHLIFGFFI